MKYPDAYTIAESIRKSLEPHCEPGRCFIAGSVRRMKPDCGDIEIVCQPKMQLHESKAPDLFGEQILESIELPCDDFCDAVDLLGKSIKGYKAGKYMQIELPYDGLMLDLFMPVPHDFFRQLAIRTGSADYSWKVIAVGWRKLGWVGTKDGLRRQEDCIEKKTAENKSTWTCPKGNPFLPPEWKSEQEFFEWLKVPYLAPEKRM